MNRQNKQIESTNQSNSINQSNNSANQVTKPVKQINATAHLDNDAAPPPLGRVDGAHAAVREEVDIFQLVEVEVQIHLMQTARRGMVRTYIDKNQLVQVKLEADPAYLTRGMHVKSRQART